MSRVQTGATLSRSSGGSVAGDEDDRCGQPRTAARAVPGGRHAEFQIKVGGHQASSASMVGIMTALWFGHLGGADKVAVKPHASPVYHAIKYLTGELDRSYLTRLRALGGLQSYPSRTKDPDVADFSTGSVGLGVVAPLFAAAAPPLPRRPLRRAGHATGRPRFIALAGDAELDEGNVWEAITDPALQGLGTVMWVVDTNRQSLDRVVPDQKIKKLMEFFDGAGWHVVEAKYGRRLKSAFAPPGGRRAAAPPRPDVQRGVPVAVRLRRRRASQRASWPALTTRCGFRSTTCTDDDLAPLVQNLGGHDLGLLLDSYRACDAVADRPSVRVRLHGQGLGAADRRRPAEPLRAAHGGADRGAARARSGSTPATEWDRFPGRLGGGTSLRGHRRGAEQRRGRRPGRCSTIPDAHRCRRQPHRPRRRRRSGASSPGWPTSPGSAERIVTASPDVSVSTNLGGWINKCGVFTPAESSPTSSARTACCAGSSHRRDGTSSWASAR